MIHLTIQQVSSYLDGELNPSSADLVRQHLESCEACASKLSRLVAQGEELADALRSDPGEGFFERLAGEIEERIRFVKSDAAGPHAAPTPPAMAPAPAPPASRRGADKPMEETPPEVEAVVPESPRARGRQERPLRRGGGRPVRWAAAVLVTAVVASAGVMVSGLGPRWLRPAEKTTPAPVATDEIATTKVAVQAAGPESIEPPPANPPEEEPEPPQPRAPQPEREANPPRGPSAPPERTPAAASPERAGSDFEPVTMRADQVLGDLPARPTPAETPAGPNAQPAPVDASPARPATVDQYESAAAYWEEQLSLLRGDEYRTARYRLAEARYHAWRIAPDGDRAARAEAAIRAYLVTARQGPQRDNAVRWLSSVEEAGYR